MDKLDHDKKHLISACLELTDECGVQCPYCLLECKQTYVSREVLLRIVDRLIEHGVRRFSIGGGEPIASRDVYTIGTYIKDAKAESLLRTSGCKPFDLGIIEQAFDLIDISIDSTSSAYYKKCKPNADITIVLRNIENILKTKLSLRCNVLVTSLNYDDVIRSINHLVSLGVTNIRMQRLVPRGLARDIYDELKVSNKDYQRILEELQYITRNSRVNISELKSTTQRALCIVKPNGFIYIANPLGLEFIGGIFEPLTLMKAGEQLYDTQTKLYGSNA